MKVTLTFVLTCVTLMSVDCCAPSSVANFFQWSDDKPKWPPSFCNKLDCPYYTVLETTEDYEVRRYNSSRWVMTSEHGVDHDTASYDEFMRLFDYISGQNSQSEKIDMTAPVLQNIIPRPDGKTWENDFTMSFYIAPKVATPPVPNNRKVHLTEMNGMTVYVRSFGGFARMNNWLSAAKELKEKLPTSAKYITQYFVAAGYDSPFKLFNRHNEVWFIAQP